MTKKKITSLLLCVIFVITVSGCGKPSVNSASSDTGEQSSVEASSDYGEPEYGQLPYYLNVLSDKAVTDAKQSASAKSKYNSFQLENAAPGKILSVQLPESIEIVVIKYFSDRQNISEESSESPRYILSVNGTDVGECLFNTLEFPEYTEKLSKDTKTIRDKLYVSKINLRCKSGRKNWEMPVYRIQVQHLTEKVFAVMYLRQDIFTYEQVTAIAGSMEFHYIPSVSRAGEIDYSGKSCRILILGNSFIGSSNIRSILQEIASDNNAQLTVDAQCRGFATLKTYTSDSNIMESIKTGIYNAVFLCGFYENMSSELEKIINVRAESTKIIVFPAYNESDVMPYKGLTLNPQAGLADWKGFINLFINKGVEKNRLCYVDEYSHSTSFAGYAGACLIYSYLYKKEVNEGTIEDQIIAEQTGSHDVKREQVSNDLADMRREAYNFLYN